MTSWTELEEQVVAQENRAAQQQWITNKLRDSLDEVSKLRESRNVFFYASAFLQKPSSPGVSIEFEDVNGLMASIYKMDCGRGLTLILHTPGGVAAATESIVDYLRSKFDKIEVIIPTYAMSAGTMISLAADRVFMAKHSQLGPIDPQIPLPSGMQVSARSIVDTFDEAKRQILDNPSAGNVWFPILQSLGPSLVTSAKGALEYSETIVGGWLAKWMMSDDDSPENAGKRIASYFNDAGKHSHGHRISRDEARKNGVIVTDLENDQALQEAVLTAYHVMTILLTLTPAVRAMATNAGSIWVKNLIMQDR